MDENIKFAVAHWILCAFHFGIMIFSAYCSVLNDMNSYNKVQSFLVFISMLPVFVSDILVASLFTKSVATSSNIYDLSINLDILSVVLYQCIFCNFVVGRSSQIFKGLALRFHDGYTALLGVKSIFSAILAVAGITICYLQDNFNYIPTFLSTFYGAMSIMNIGFAMSVRFKLQSLQLVFTSQAASSDGSVRLRKLVRGNSLEKSARKYGFKTSLVSAVSAAPGHSRTSTVSSTATGSTASPQLYSQSTTNNGAVSKTEFERFCVEFRKFTIGTLCNMTIYLVLAAILVSVFSDGSQRGGHIVSFSWKIMEGVSCLMSQVIVFNMRGQVVAR